MKNLLSLNKIIFLGVVALFIVVGSVYLYLHNMANYPLSFTKMDRSLPTIDLPSLDGDDYRLPDRPFLLITWATWCPSCIAEHSYLAQVASDIVLVGIVLRDDENIAKQFLRDRGNPFAHNFFDSIGSYSESIGSFGTPTVYFIDSDKTIRGRLLGGLNKRKWQENRLDKFALSLK